MVFPIKSRNASSLHPNRSAAPGIYNRGPIGGFLIVLITSLLIPANVGAGVHKKPCKTERLFPHALAIRGCTQEDAPAMEIYFTPGPYTGDGDAPPPYLRFEISSSAAEAIPPSTFELLPLRLKPIRPIRIVRAELVESLYQSTWLTGIIVLDAVKPGERVTGHYSVKTPDGRHFDSAFESSYQKRIVTCG